MSNLNIEIGKRIRGFRKMRGMTLTELSLKIHKGPSTLSKYETGEITLDIEAIYEIASVLNVHVEELLPSLTKKENSPKTETNPAFFNGLDNFYAYMYDGRSNELIRCFCDVIFSGNDRRIKVIIYMNFKDYNFYQNCENTYIGYMEHYDALTNILLTNQDTPMEKAHIQILASYLDSDTKWGLWTGFSSRPMMPVATKMLISKKRLTEDKELINMLKISKEDIKMMKLYNMFSVT